MINPVSKIESEILALFRRTADELSMKYPNVKVRAYSSPSGSATQYQGHDIVIDCLLTNAPIAQSDNLALSVSLCHLTTQPKINADVCWGHPSGAIEASFYEGWVKNDDWPLATKETIDKLIQDLPRLIAALEQAIKRGQPLESQ